MKYYSELSEIETQIIRLSSMSSLIRVVAIGAEQANHEDVKNALWYIEGSIEDIHDCLDARFNELWDTVRDEDSEPEEKHKGGMKKKKQMTDRDL
jgi:predicted transcriptional regulator